MRHVVSPRLATISLLITSFLSNPVAMAWAQTPLQTKPPTQPPAAPVSTASPAVQDPAAPSGQDPTGVVRISTQLVQIDAIVTGKKGEHVENLNEEDFELTVDGKPQPLTYLKLVKLVDDPPAAPPAKEKGKEQTPPLTSMPTKQIEQERVRRTIALVVDDLGLSFASGKFAKDALRRFVAEQMQEGDLVGIVRTGGGLGIYQQFTSDKRVLYAAIDKLKFALNGRRAVPFTLASNSSLMGKNEPFKTDSEKETEDRNNPQGVLGRNVEKNIDVLRDLPFAYGTLGALNYVVRALKPLPGRKLAVVLSDGLIINVARGRNAGMDMSRASDMNARLMTLVELANRASVAFYSVNVEGLLAPFGDTAIEGMDDATGGSLSGGNSFNDALRILARGTGGLAFYNSNNTDALLKKAVDDNRSYYLLGFDPEDEKFDRKHHKISLRVKRPGLTVRTREGFFGVADATLAASEKAKTPESQLLAALFSPFGAKDIPYQVTSLFFSSQAGEPIIRSYFHIDGSKLKFQDEPDGQKSVRLELVNFTFNEAGAVVESYAQAFTLKFDEARYRRALSEGLVYLNDFPVKKPGAYQLRSALRDAGSGLLGSSSQFIQIPNLSKDRLTLSGIIINAVNSDAAKSASNSGNVLEAEVQANPAARRFATNSELEYLAAIYGSRLDKQTGKPRLKLQFELYRDSTRIFQSPERPVRADQGGEEKWPGWLDCGGRFQLKNFAAGDYLLRLLIRDELREGKDAVVEQWIDFSVR